MADPVDTTLQVTDSGPWPTDGSGLRLENIRRRNAASVLRAIVTRGPVSRTEISMATGLSGGPITKITTDLKAVGLITEGEAPHSGREPGRPRVPISVDRHRYRFGGIHIGLRRTTVGLINLSGDLVVQRVALHSGQGAGPILAEARKLIAATSRDDGGDVLGVGICTGGWVDPAAGLVRDHPVLGWHNARLSNAVAWTGVPVIIDSSVRALARAEAHLGAAQGFDNALYVFVGNVVGAVQLLDGQVAAGRGSAAGLIDHLPVGPEVGITCSCGRRDCLWALASDVAVVTRAREHGVIGGQDQLEELITAAGGDGPSAAAAARILRDRARYAGVAIGLLMDLFAPNVVVIGGGVLQAPEHLDELRAAAVGRSGQHADFADGIRPSALGEEALVRGAAALALDDFYRDPLRSFPPAVGVLRRR